MERSKICTTKVETSLVAVKGLYMSQDLDHTFVLLPLYIQSFCLDQLRVLCPLPAKKKC